uniref:Uncharacterized protein n=1 Tax=Solanum lycopersicum TaxID=4081 RepID=A0A3Q7GGL1_SOLLC
NRFPCKSGECQGL